MVLFDCRVWAQQGCGGETGKTIRWSFPLVTVQPDSGFNWKASNRLIVHPQAHFPPTGRVLHQSGFRSRLFDFNKLTMAAGCGRFLVKNPFIDDWLDSWKRVCSSWRGREWRWSDLICCSTATIPSLVLLGSFLFTLSIILFARAPHANWRRCAVRAAFIAKIQYFCESTLDLLRSLKLISSKNRLSAGTSSGASPASNSSSRAISSTFFLWR